MSFFDIFMKSPNSERTDFCRVMGPKEIYSPLNLQPKSLFWVKNFFINTFLRIIQNMTVFLKKVLRQKAMKKSKY